MSGGVCAVYGCCNATVKNCSKAFFRFPLNTEVCKQWMVNCKRSDLDAIFKKGGVKCLNRSHRVCSDHFVESHFRNTRLFSQGLIKGAIPSIKLHWVQLKTRKGPFKGKLPQNENLKADVMEDRIPQTVAEYHSEFKKRKGNMCDSPNTVAKKLRLLQKYKSRYTQTIANLKQQVLTLQKQNEELKSELKKLRPSNSIMTPLDNVECKPRGRRYSELQKNFALALHYCSAKCYRLYKLFKNTKERLLKT